MQRVDEVMTPEPVVVHGDTTLPDCASLMRAHHIRHLPVVGLDGVALGVVLDAEVFRLGGFASSDSGAPSPWVWFDEAKKDAHAADVLTRCQVTAQVTDPLTTLLRRWRLHSDDVALILDGDHLIGIMTEHDVASIAVELLSPNLLVDHAGNDALVEISSVATVRNALDKLAEHRIRHLLVREGGSVVGVVSLRDLVEVRAEDTLDDPITPIVRRDLVTLELGSSLKQAAEVLVRHKIGALPIVRGAAIVRVLTRRDLLLALTGTIEEDASFPADGSHRAFRDGE